MRDAKIVIKKEGRRVMIWIDGEVQTDVTLSDEKVAQLHVIGLLVGMAATLEENLEAQVLEGFDQ